VISGKIKTYEEPRKYQSYNFYDNDSHEWGDFGGIGFRQKTPTYSEQPKLIQEAIEIAATLGFIVGARVKRRNGIENLGTITHIHESFTQAWNYSTGELEPIKVTWDNKAGATGGAYDYSIADLELVIPSKLPALFLKKDEFHEGLPNLHQSC